MQVFSYFSVSEFKLDHVIEMLEWILVGAIVLCIINNLNSNSFVLLQLSYKLLVELREISVHGITEN